MPRDSDKNNNSRGRRDRPGSGTGRAGDGKARWRWQGPLRGGTGSGEEVRQARICRQGRRRQARRRAASLCREVRWRQVVWQEALFRRWKTLRRQGATATIVRRAGTLAMHRVRAATGHLLAVRHAVTMVKSVRSSRVKIVAVATSARSSRVVTVRISIATTVRRAGMGGIATMHARQDVFPTGNLATRSPMPREKVAARSGPTRRAAKGFARTATVRVAIGPLVPGRRAMAIARGDRPERKFGGDKKFSRGAPDRGPAQGFWRRPRQFEAVAEARGSRRRGPSALFAFARGSPGG